MATASNERLPGLFAPRLLAVLLAALGLALSVGGAQLIQEGGSAYFVMAGVALVICAGFLWAGRMLGIALYVVLMVATGVWSIAEVGLDPWALLPRVGLLVLIGIYMLFPFNWRPLVLTRGCASDRQGAR